MGDTAFCRYGRGGECGVGYYLVADNYIALMSRWTTCGAWEGHAILDFLKENESEVKPDTIHADTQGQSSAIFGLAYLLGIQLLPRIRDWKGKNFYRSAPETRFQHIDSLFTSQVDWSLIEAMLPELLRVAVSIKRCAFAVRHPAATRQLLTQEQAVLRSPRTRLRRSYHVPIALRLGSRTAASHSVSHEQERAV
jgi:TnpA family transposase